MNLSKYANMRDRIISKGFIRSSGGPSSFLFRGEGESYTYKVLRPDGKVAYMVTMFAYFDADIITDHPVSDIRIEWSVIITDPGIRIDRIEIIVNDEYVSIDSVIDFAADIYLSALKMSSHTL